jgi:hypothetical protein
MPQLFAAFANQAYEYKDDGFQGRDSFIKICNVHESNTQWRLKQTTGKTSSKEKRAFLVQKTIFLSGQLSYASHHNLVKACSASEN